MVAACVEPLPLYRPRDPQASDLWRLLDQHFETFQQVYDERFAAKYGFWRPIVERSVKAFLKCGDLHEGWHPHVHVLLTCGAFTCEDQFLELPELDLDRLQTAWQEAVFALYLAEEKIEPEVVENMRTWPHSGFSVDQSVYLPAGDRAGIERLVGYMTRCPFSLSRLVQVTPTGQVIYKAEKDACRAFPDPQDEGLASGPTRNFQILDPLDFLAEFTQHIPPQGAHLIRYYGWYSKQESRSAAEAGGSRCGGAAGKLGRSGRRTGAGPHAPQPDLGDADQTGFRDRPADLPSLFRPDENRRLPGATAG